MFYESVDGGLIVLVGHIWFSGDGLDEVSAGGEEVKGRQKEKNKTKGTLGVGERGSDVLDERV